MMMYLCMSKSLHFSSLLTSPLPHTGYALTYKCSVIRYDITPLLTGFLYSHSTHNEAIFLKLFNEFLCVTSATQSRSDGLLQALGSIFLSKTPAL